MSDFFARFAGFKPDPSAPAKEEFARLSKHRNWKKGGKKWTREWNNFIIEEFAKHYGGQETKLAGWQALCEEVGVKESIEELNSITKCKKALKKVHVNLVDLIDGRRERESVKNEPRSCKQPSKVKIFRNEVALRKYTKYTGKIFPKWAAKKDGFLAILLRQIF